MAPNRLSREKSPYLLQHQNNPVNWYAWGPEAFEAARRDNKPIFLSIGYSTCHWCHVMEHDSFEKDEVAKILNEHFISIKVDREERPDVDQIHMDVVVALTGHGGWPMSVFLTPDLKPFFGGTFFWKAQFLSLLSRINELWRNQPAQISEEAQKLVSHLSHTSHSAPDSHSLNPEILTQAISLYQSSFDDSDGGFGRAPKFPRSLDLSLLLRLYRRFNDPAALLMAEKTLACMANGGLYDHLGGGFHRYSTDSQWLTPHFEKMLYDNALLIGTYLEAFQLTRKPFYAQVAQETLDYVLREMTQEEGGFYSAQDADTEGEEGKFYVWTIEEIESLLTPEEAQKFIAVFGVTPQGNFEHGTNILHVKKDDDWSHRANPLLASARRKLFEAREKRIHPFKDDKILTEWNGLMISAMALGFKVLGHASYLKAAQDSARFILKNLYRDEKLLRRYRAGEGGLEGVLDDYAFLIRGLIDLYEADFDAAWLDWALKLQKKQDQLFADPDGGLYFYSAASATDLFVRKKETNDGAMPSGNGVAVSNLLKLASYFFDENLRKKAHEVLAFLARDVKRYPPAHAMALMGFDFDLGPTSELALVGSLSEPEVQKILEHIRKGFYPRLIVAVGEDEVIPLLQGRGRVDGKPAFYLCEQNVCQKPETDAEVIIRKISS